MYDILRRNLGYKIISLVLAIVFWLWITSQAEPAGLWGKQTREVPLVVNNQPANLVIISDIPSSITVRLDNNNIEEGVNVKNLFAYIDLKDAVAGEQSYEVMIDAPEGVVIESKSPGAVVLKLDTVKDKIIPVIANIIGTPADGFIHGNPIITPPVVNVRGPTSVLDKLEEVVVEVNVTSASESMRVARPVTFKDMQGRGVFASNPNLESLQAFPNTVEIIVPLYAKGTASKTVPLKANTRGTPAQGLTVRAVTPLPSQIQLTGDEKVLNTIQQLSLGTVDVSGLTGNKVYNIPLTGIDLPEGVSFVEGTSLSVLVQIGPGSVDRVIKDIPVGIRNIPQNLAAEPISSVEITVRGFPDVLDTFKPGDISVWVDAAGMEEGVYPETDVLWKLPSGTTMIQVPKVKLVLKTVEADTGERENAPLQMLNIIENEKENKEDPN